MSYIPDPIILNEGGESPTYTNRNLGEIYPFRVQLLESDGPKLDTTAFTLTASLYNSAGSSVVITPTLVKDLNELGIVNVSGITFSTTGTFNFYINCTNAPTVRKFGPLKIKVSSV